MDRDSIKLNWERVGKLAQANWGWLTDAQLKSVGGDLNKLEALIASECGITIQEAKHQTQEFGLKVEAAPGDIVPPAPPGAKPAAAGTSVNVPVGGSPQ